MIAVRRCSRELDDPHEPHAWTVRTLVRVDTLDVAWRVIAELKARLSTGYGRRVSYVVDDHGRPAVPEHLLLFAQPTQPAQPPAPTRRIAAVRVERDRDRPVPRPFAGGDDHPSGVVHCSLAVNRLPFPPSWGPAFVPFSEMPPVFAFDDETSATSDDVGRRRRCRQCAAEFRPTVRHRRYCEHCSPQRWAGAKPRRCRYCATEFRPTYQIRGYCSPECQHAGTAKRISRDRRLYVERRRAQPCVDRGER